MAFDKYQFESFIVRPALEAIDLCSDEAVNLILGTAAQETAFGTELVQKGIGYAGGIGIYQMQSPTFNYVWDSQVTPSFAMRNLIKAVLGYDGKPPIQRLASDLLLATIVARLYYKIAPEKIPKPNDIPGLAAYYKKYWNTEKGAATTDEFIANYKRYVEIHQ